MIIVLVRKSKKKKKAKQEAEAAALLAQEQAEQAAMAAVAAKETGADIMDLNMEKSMELRKTVRQFSQNNPEIAAQMIKAWLKGEDDNG